MGPVLLFFALRAGEFACLDSMVGSAELVRHLAEMGFRSETHLKMVRPGSTCILKGARLSVRGDELWQALVSPLPAARHLV